MPAYEVETWYETHEGPGLETFYGSYRTPELAVFVAGAQFFGNFPQVARVRHVIVRDAGKDRVALIAHMHDHAHGHGDDYKPGHDFVLVTTADIRREHDRKHAEQEQGS